MPDKQRMGLWDRMVSGLAKRQIQTKIQKIENIYQERIEEINDLNNKKTPSNGSSVAVKLTKFYQIIRRKLGFDSYYVNNYDFKSLRSAYENESYVRRAVDHYTETVMRNGFSIVGENEDNVLYIKRRLAEFDMVSGVSTEDNIRHMVPQFLLYGNCISSLSRGDLASSGDRYKRFDGKEMVPIAAMYVEDAKSIAIKNDTKRGLVYERTYEKDFGPTNPTSSNTASFQLSALNSFSFVNQQESDSTLKKDDIYHFGFHRQPGDMWAVPPYAAVLDDIRTLRSIEENVELLVFQYGHGILHAQVGDDKKTGTEGEIRDLTQKIQDMESNGCLITDNRVEIAIKGVEGSAVDVSKYLDYFKARVFSGLYMSDVGMGEGSTANRNTADALGKDSVDRTNEIQRYISEIYNKLFKELLLERGFSYKEVNDERNQVHLSFPEVDIGAKIKVEEHYTNMYVQGVITLDEARERIGLKNIDETTEQRLYSNMVTLKQTEIEGQIQKEIANSKSMATAAKAKQTGAAKKTQQRKRPVNQYGTRTTPTVVKK